MTDEERKARKLAWWRAYTAAHPDKVRAYNKAYYAAHQADVSAWGKTYRATRKEQLHSAEKAWRLAHPEQRRANREAHYATNRAREIAAAKNYRDTHREEWRQWHAQYSEKNREILSERFTVWARANRDRLRAYRRENAGAANARTARRRATVLRATPGWADTTAIKEIYQESVRLTRHTGIKHDVDHIYPLQGKTVCGLHVAANLRIITKLENVRKGNKLSPTVPPQ